MLFYHPLNIYRKQVIKQADVVLAMFLLGDAFPPEAKKRNFDFYDPLTTGNSSLSSCVEAIIAAQTGDMDKAIRYGMAALLMDLADVGGNVKDGCHIASMGGTWMMLAYGFGGMRDDDGTLSFWPRRAPQENAILRFPVTYRGQMVEIEIGQEKVEYTLREGDGLTIRHEKEEIQPDEGASRGRPPGEQEVRVSASLYPRRFGSSTPSGVAVAVSTTTPDQSRSSQKTSWPKSEKPSLKPKSATMRRIERMPPRNPPLRACWLSMWAAAR